jgi:hypothetical protein
MRVQVAKESCNDETLWTLLIRNVCHCQSIVKLISFAVPLTGYVLYTSGTEGKIIQFEFARKSFTA